MDILLGMVVDRSGSMDSIWDDTVGGIKTFLKDQRALEGRAFLTLVGFDNEYTLVYDSAPLDTVQEPLKGLYPRSSTALVDSVYKAIRHVEYTQKFNQFAPKDVVFVIVTDGYENASREHTTEELSKLIERKQEEGWQFVFLGADQSAWSSAGRLGINPMNSFKWDKTSEGTQLAYNTVSAGVSEYRSSGLKSALNITNEDKVESEV